MYYKYRNATIHFLYVRILKPILFLFDPEDVHNLFLSVGSFLGRFSLTRWKTKILLGYKNPILEQNIRGIKFENPIGLAAGFDKDAVLTQIISSVGFGFEEVGSITGEKCEGNPKPRLWRLKKSKALAVYYGLKNEGAEKISEKLKGKKFKIPIFTSTLINYGNF